MKLVMNNFLVLMITLNGAVYACMSNMVPPPVDSLKKSGFLIKVEKDDGKEDSFRFHFTLDKKLPWIAGSLLNDKGESTSLVLKELKDGSRTFTFSLNKQLIAKSKIILTHGKNGDDGHWRGGSTSLELGPIYTYLTKAELHNKNSEPEGSH